MCYPQCDAAEQDVTEHSWHEGKTTLEVVMLLCFLGQQPYLTYTYHQRRADAMALVVLATVLKPSLADVALPREGEK